MTTAKVNMKKMLEWLANNGMFYVIFNTRVDGVDIPFHLKAEEQCTLKFSYAFSPDGKADLEIFDDSIQQTLSFGGKDYLCRIPFKAFVGVSASTTTSLPKSWTEATPDQKVAPKLQFGVIDGGKK